VYSIRRLELRLHTLHATWSPSQTYCLLPANSISLHWTGGLDTWKQSELYRVSETSVTNNQSRGITSHKTINVSVITTIIQSLLLMKESFFPPCESYKDADRNHMALRNELTSVAPHEIPELFRFSLLHAECSTYLPMLLALHRRTTLLYTAAVVCQVTVFRLQMAARYVPSTVLLSPPSFYFPFTLATFTLSSF